MITFWWKGDWRRNTQHVDPAPTTWFIKKESLKPNFKSKKKSVIVVVCGASSCYVRNGMVCPWLSLKSSKSQKLGCKINSKPVRPVRFAGIQLAIHLLSRWALAYLVRSLVSCLANRIESAHSFGVWGSRTRDCVGMRGKAPRWSPGCMRWRGSFVRV